MCAGQRGWIRHRTDVARPSYVLGDSSAGDEASPAQNDSIAALGAWKSVGVGVGVGVGGQSKCMLSSAHCC